MSRHECGGYFWAALPRHHWPEDRAHIDRVWMEGNGDCRQEIVLIGQNMNQEALTEMLDDCLLTEEEPHLMRKVGTCIFLIHFQNGM